MNRIIVSTCLGLMFSIIGLRVVTDAFGTLPPPPPGDPQQPLIDHIQTALQLFVHQFVVFATVGGGCLLLLVMFVLGASWLQDTRFERLPDPAKPDDLEALRGVLRSVRAWLKQQQLPGPVTTLVQSISDHCDELDRLLDRRVYADVATTVHALPKLLGTELSELVRRYRKIPNAQKRIPLLNQSANELLQTGLCGVDEQLRAVQEQLANDDVRELATQSRYLELVGQSAGASDSSPESAAERLQQRSASPTLKARGFRLSGTARDVVPAASGQRAPIVQLRDTRDQSPRAPAHPNCMEVPTRGIPLRAPTAPNEVGGSLLSDVLPLVSLGVAAGAAAAVVSACCDSGENTDDALADRADGGFGGAGASGEWCDNPGQETEGIRTQGVDAGDEPDADDGRGCGSAPDDDQMTSFDDNDSDPGF